MDEKRRCHRINIQLSSCYQAPNSQKNLSIATTLDVSAIGLCLISKEKLSVGDELPIQIALPTGEKIIINIKVIWVKDMQTLTKTEYRIGVKILEPMRADELKFVKFFAKEFLTTFSKKSK